MNAKQTIHGTIVLASDGSKKAMLYTFDKNGKYIPTGRYAHDGEKITGNIVSQLNPNVKLYRVTRPNVPITAGVLAKDVDFGSLKSNYSNATGDETTSSIKKPITKNQKITIGVISVVLAIGLWITWKTS